MKEVTIIKKDVELREQYCSCGYKLQAFVAVTQRADVAGFSRHPIVTCPICGNEVYF